MLRTGLIIGLLMGNVPGQAAEVVGEIQPRQAGLFHGQGTKLVGNISISLLPMQGQPLPYRRSAQTHRLVLADRQLRPEFLTVQRGDTVQFINQDDVYHELFSLSPSQPIDLHLGKVSEGEEARAEVVLETEGSWHLFCRIHSRMYARVDAVASPLIQMVGPGQPFRFDHLATGKWQVRVAALGAETRIINTEALTAPPPLRIDLFTKEGGSGSPRQGLPVQGHVEELFPKD